MGSKPRLRPLNPNSKISMKDLDSLRNLLQPPGRILEQGVQDGTNWVLSREDGGARLGRYRQTCETSSASCPSQELRECKAQWSCRSRASRVGPSAESFFRKEARDLARASGGEGALAACRHGFAYRAARGQRVIATRRRNAGPRDAGAQLPAAQ